MKRVIGSIAVLIIALTISVKSAEAQAQITIEVPEADYSFGQQITFRLKASAPGTINEVNLFLRIQGRSDTTAVPVSFAPGSQLAIELPYSLVGQDVPPFSTVVYWWEIHDVTGGMQESEKRSLYYTDNRYPWQTLGDQQQGVSWEVYWVQGNVVFGQTALNVGVKALEEIYREIKGPAPGTIRIFVYPSEEDLHSALRLASYEWAGGQARPELGAILVGIPDSPAAPGDMERLIPHELTHLMVYEATGRVLGSVPPWLDEGLASLNELRPDPARQTLLEQKLAENALFPLEALCAPFPADEEAARLAYAQSASVVNYLRETYGSQVIRDLLATYADNASCEAGVTRVLDKRLSGLDVAWRADLTRQGELGLALSDSALWLALWILTALLVIPLVGALRNKEGKEARGEA